MPVTTYRYAGPGMLTAENRNGTQSAYQFDAWGSTAQLVNSSGTVTDTVRFDWFGNEAVRTGTTTLTLTWQPSACARAQSYYSTIVATVYMPTLFVVANRGENSFGESTNPGDTFWNKEDYLRKRTTPADWESCRKKCVRVAGRYPVLDTDCFRKCLADLLLPRLLSLGQSFPDCCKVYVIVRRVSWTRLYHPWFWVDKNCDKQPVSSEIYGYGPATNYGFEDSWPEVEEDMEKTCWILDPDMKKVYTDVFYARLDGCSCDCIAKWWESHFGWEGGTYGRPWNPKDYPLLGVGANSIHAVQTAVNDCCPKEQVKWTAVRPDESMKPWPPRGD